MTFGRKILIALAVPFLLALALLPLTLRRALFAYDKYAARRTFEKFSPIVRRNLDLLPTAISLPPPPADLVRDSAEFNNFVLRFPAPLDKVQKPHAISLTYPTFRVIFLEPTSTERLEAAMKLTGGMDLHGDAVKAAHTRLGDIESCSSPADLKGILQLLKRKDRIWDLAACFEEFDQPDRWGFIRATDVGDKKLNVEIYFPRSHVSCGFYMDNFTKTSVPVATVHQFAACIDIERAPATTSYAPH